MSTLTKIHICDPSCCKTCWKTIMCPIISSIKPDQFLNFVSTSIIRISSYILCLLSSKKNKHFLKSWDYLGGLPNTFQFLGGEDIMLPFLIYFILRMKTANGIKILANQWSECSVNAKIGSAIVLGYNNLGLCNMLFIISEYEWELLPRTNWSTSRLISPAQRQCRYIARWMR